MEITPALRSTHWRLTEDLSRMAGRLETGSYTNKDGVKVYTTTVIVEEQEFAESKASSQNNAGGNYQQPVSNNSSSGDGFMNVPDGIDEELPFV